jgi:hypothetical protein
MGPEIVESEETVSSDGYKKAYDDLMESGRYTPRKAKRYLDSIAKRNMKKQMKRRVSNV